MNVQGQPDSYKVGVLLCLGSLLILEYLAQALVSHASYHFIEAVSLRHFLYRSFEYF